MNYRLVFQIIGRLCALLGVVLLVPAGVSFLAGDSRREWLSFLGAAVVGFAVWGLSRQRQPGDSRVSAADGFGCVTLGWVLVGLIGALPYWMSGSIPSFTDAFFESVSGFTTTGGSILRDVEALSQGMHLWRSLTQWLGGMGIVALFVALLPALGAGGNFLFQAEVPGPTPGRIKPRISDTAKVLWTVYLFLTLSLIGLLWICGMTPFEAVCHAFTTLSTGGFSTSNASVGNFSPTIQWIITVFMFLGGVNFAMHFLLFHRNWRAVVHNQEVRLYAVLTVIAIVILCAAMTWMDPAIPASAEIAGDEAVPGAFLDKLRHAAFQTVSIVTTTGFGTHDFNRWPYLCQIVLVTLMFSGACAGSTSGGMKLARIMVLWKFVTVEVKRVMHPSAVLFVKFGKRHVEPSAVTGTLGFFVLFLGLYAVGVLVMLTLGKDMTTSLTSVVACLSNIGPGLGEVGPTGNFADIPAAGKWMLSGLMLLGRLEIYSVLMIFTPWLWKK